MVSECIHDEIEGLKRIWAREIKSTKTLEMSCEVETLTWGEGSVPGSFSVF
jgi:hypothetical protein